MLSNSGTPTDRQSLVITRWVLPVNDEANGLNSTFLVEETGLAGLINYARDPVMVVRHICVNSRELGATAITAKEKIVALN